ncbi:cysteine repeat modular protein [Plasmodium falciparum IGH-CR14]|uniref:Cysteine repeat modular protein n=1 Tax=Plasmodium falciparum IGH-CR14 TaxID=580059 RepID=A0A0L1I477_PLAFA|nr:cysteine repeat modular protein [Plasmodium falciparum IGH-CR14]
MDKHFYDRNFYKKHNHGFTCNLFLILYIPYKRSLCYDTLFNQMIKESTFPSKINVTYNLRYYILDIINPNIIKVNIFINYLILLYKINKNEIYARCPFFSSNNNITKIINNTISGVKIYNNFPFSVTGTTLFIQTNNINISTIYHKLENIIMNLHIFYSYKKFIFYKISKNVFIRKSIIIKYPNKRYLSERKYIEQNQKKSLKKLKHDEIKKVGERKKEKKKVRYSSYNKSYLNDEKNTFDNLHSAKYISKNRIIKYKINKIKKIEENVFKKINTKKHHINKNIKLESSGKKESKININNIIIHKNKDRHLMNNTNFVENPVTNDYIIYKQEFIRSVNTLTSLKLYGMNLNYLEYQILTIYDSTDECSGTKLAEINILEKYDSYMITDSFKIKKVGLFLICITLTSVEYVGVLKVQNNLIDDFDSIINNNNISTFNCSTDAKSILIYSKERIINLNTINNEEIKPEEFINLSKYSEYLQGDISLLACCVNSNGYVVVLDKDVIFVLYNKILKEIIIHFLKNPIAIYLYNHTIFITDAERKNIFRFVSKYILKKTSKKLTPIWNYYTYMKLQEENGVDLGKNMEGTSELISNILKTNKLLEKADTIKRMDEFNNGESYLIKNTQLLNSLRNFPKINKYPISLLNENFTLNYPSGIVVVNDTIYFVDTGLHVLFAYSLQKGIITEMFGYVNHEVKSENGLNKPYSLSLFSTNNGNTNLLFLSELTSSRILIFEINNSIKLYLIYNNNINFDIITSIVTTSYFLIICGLKQNMDIYKSYITFIKIEELSDIDIQYNEYDTTLYYGKKFSLDPLIKSPNINEFKMEQIDKFTNKIINTGLTIHKDTGIISGRINISAEFHINIFVKDYFKKKKLTFVNFVSLCPKGFNIENNKCIPCPIGLYYSNSKSINQCIPCENYRKHSTTLYNSAKSKTECLCKPGYFLKDKRCVKCVAGFYKDQIGNFKCQGTCENTKMSIEVGAKNYEELKCTCKDGYFTEKKKKECIPCPFGNYCIYNPKVKYKADIIRCKNNKLTLHRGSKSPNDCLCSQGYYHDYKMDECELCNYDQYKSHISNDPCVPFISKSLVNQEYLINEPYFQYTNIYIKQTSNIIFAPKKGSKMFHEATLCETGYSYSMNKSICSICRYNNYCLGLDHSSIICPKNSITIKLKSVSALDCLCIKGYGRIIINTNQSFTISCIPCPYNTFQPHHSYGKCIPCPPHTFTKITGATSITECIPKMGYYNISFEYIYEYSKQQMLNSIPHFIQYYHYFLKNQYEHFAKGKNNQKKMNNNNNNKKYTCTTHKRIAINNKSNKHKKFPRYINVEEKKYIYKDKYNIPQITNNIHGLKSPYNNIFHTNYLKNIFIFMDLFKMNKYIYNQKSKQHRETIIYGHNNLSFVHIKNEKDFSYDEKKSKYNIKMENNNNNNNNNNNINIYSNNNLNFVRQMNEKNKEYTKLLSTKKRNISQSTSFLNNKIIYDDYRNLIFNTSDTYNHNVSKSINIISHDINDILKIIKAREENYFINKNKDIKYTCYENEENETSKKRNHFMYVYTIPEIDVMSCLNSCISNIYCTGIEMNTTDDKGKTNLFLMLYRSYGKTFIYFYKCSLYFYEDLTSYYKKENFKVIKNVEQYNNTHNKIISCVIQKNPILHLWKIYSFQKCPHNYYCEQESLKKKKCPPNSIKTKYDGTINDCLCLPGYYLKGNIQTCIPCEKGSYKNTISNDSCIKCPINFTTLFETSNSVYDCVCRKGYYFSWNTNIDTNDIEKKNIYNNNINSIYRNKNEIKLIKELEEEYAFNVEKKRKNKHKFILHKKLNNRYRENIHKKQISLKRKIKFLNEQKEINNHLNFLHVNEILNISFFNDNQNYIYKNKNKQENDTNIEINPVSKQTSLHSNNISNKYMRNNFLQINEKLYINNSNNNYNEYIHKAQCTKCPRKMFCPGYWLENYENEIHHPPIYCPKGSLILGTTIESTDIHKCICRKGYSINLSIKPNRNKNVNVNDNDNGNNNNNSNNNNNNSNGNSATLNNNNNMCVMCKEGYYKDVIDNSVCAGLCIEFSTSFKGSISKKQCFCTVGKYMIQDEKDENKCINCSKGSICIGGFKFKSLRELIKNQYYINLNIYDHSIPLPKKGYFATFQINHEDFKWKPLNSLHIEINNYEKGNIIITDKIILNVFHKKLHLINIGEKNKYDQADQGIYIKKNLNNNSFIHNNNNIKYIVEESKHLRDRTMANIPNEPILVNEKLEPIIYKNNFLMIDRIPDFHLCPISNRCMGTSSNLCFKGSEGYLCNNCSNSYDVIHFRSQCIKCRKKKTEMINLLIHKFFFIMEPIENHLKNYQSYFQLYIILPMRFIAHYFKLNCFFNNSYNEINNNITDNKVHIYIYIWYIQRFLKIAEPIFDCILFTLIFFIIYVLYISWNNEKIQIAQSVIKKQIENIQNNSYGKHIYDFYYYYYQNNVINIIKNTNNNCNVKNWSQSYYVHDYLSKTKKKKQKKKLSKWSLTQTKKKLIQRWKHKISRSFKHKKENSENYDYFENKENKENNSLCSESTKHDNTINNNYTTSSVEDKFIYTKKKTTYNNNTNQSCDDENIYNVKEKLLKKDITNNFGYEHIEKEKYWTSICLSNIYNIRALGLFRYIHPYNINIWDKMKRILSDLSCVYIIILYIYFPFIIINLLELVWCQPIQYKENPSLLILYHMPSQVCDLQNKLFLSGVLYSCFFLIIYIILFSIYIYDTSKSIKAIGSYSNNLKSYFLFNGHNYQNRCWEIINIIKVSFIIIPFICQLYTKRNVNSKYFICCCIVLVLITEVACILFYSPYDKRSDNLLQKLSLTSSFFILISYLTVQVGFFFDVTILNIIPIFLFFYFHVYVIKQIILDFAIYKNILKRKDNHISFDKKKKSNDMLNDYNFLFFFDKIEIDNKDSNTPKGIDTTVQCDEKEIKNKDDINNFNHNKINDVNNKRKKKKKKKKKKDETTKSPYNEEYNLLNFVLSSNNIPSYSIYFDDKEEEIYLFQNNNTRGYEYKKKIINNMKYNNDIKIEQTKRISLDLLHSDILYYNIRKGTINSDISNMNTYNNIKMRKQENNYYHQNDCNNINSDDYNNVCVQKRISNKLEHFIRIEREYDKEKHYIKNNEKNNSEDDMFFLNITHFINCFIDAINILYINQSYDKITVEWLSFITRFSICFIHWMKNHDENLINFVPLNDKQFELKKRNLLFYSLFTSYTEIYNLYHSINNSNSLAGCKKRFINSKNVSKPYKHIKKIKNKQGDLYGINNLNDTKDIGDKYQRNYKRNNYYNGNIKNEHLNNYDLNNYDLNNYDLDDYHIYNNDIYNNDIYNNHIDNIHLDNNHLDNHKKDKPFIITSASSPSLPCFNISDDQFFRCENDIIKLLFDETLFNNLTITLMEFYFAIYIIQFIESKKLSILINLFCEKKKFLSKERQFLKILMSRKHIIQKIIDKNNLSTHMNEYIEYNYYLEYNKKLKKQREKLLNLIINKKGQIRTLKSIKNLQLMEENMVQGKNNINTHFVKTLKKLLEHQPSHQSENNIK